MMIQNIQQLNKFIALAGVKSEAGIIPALIQKQEIISENVARLILSRQHHTTKQRLAI